MFAGKASSAVAPLSVSSDWLCQRFCSLALISQYWLSSLLLARKCSQPSMSSSDASAEGFQVNCTAQQKPVEAIGRLAEAAAMSVAVPAPAGCRPLLGRMIGAAVLTRPATPLGQVESTKLAVEPGP